MKSTICTLLFLLFSILMSCSESYAQDVSRPSDVLKGISEDVVKELRGHRPGNTFPKKALEKANQQMESYCKGKTGTFSVVVEEVDEKHSRDGNITIFAKESTERLLGKVMTLKEGFIVDVSQKAKTDKIKPGSRATATGTPWGLLDWSERAQQYTLNFYLDKAVLK